MVRWVGVAMIMFSSMGIGFYFSALVKGRLDNLRELKKTMMRLRGEIEYAATPLPEALASASRYSGKDFRSFFETLIDRLDRMDGKMFGSVWKECVEKEMKDVCLVKKDKVELIKFGEGIGYLDKTMQINTIDWYVSEVEQEINVLNGEMKQKVKLYNVLGVMGGVFLVILFI